MPTSSICYMQQLFKVHLDLWQWVDCKNLLISAFSAPSDSTQSLAPRLVPRSQSNIITEGREDFYYPGNDRFSAKVLRTSES